MKTGIDNDACFFLINFVYLHCKIYIVMKKSLLYIILGMFGLLSCEKKMQITYPVSTNFGENIFLLPDGIPDVPTKIFSGESYSLEADLTRKSSLRVVFTNTSKDDAPTTYRWLFNNKIGWYADNFVSGVQEFTTQNIGKSDLNMVFQGDSGAVRIDVYENGAAEPINVKYLYWE